MIDNIEVIINKGFEILPLTTINLEAKIIFNKLIAVNTAATITKRKSIFLTISKSSLTITVFINSALTVSGNCTKPPLSSEFWITCVNVVLSNTVPKTSFTCSRLKCFLPKFNPLS
ncbi:hypothetical protein [Mesoplasma florum]|uniref:hypothetical protein n=1 Tax=Mesoplasma florum TaxID=2151 RepID=UPI001319EF2A|nr:hypothetical protein [Mesoplasma florum]